MNKDTPIRSERKVYYESDSMINVQLRFVEMVENCREILWKFRVNINEEAELLLPRSGYSCVKSRQRKMLARSAFCRAVASAAGGARVVARKFHFSAPSAAFAIRKPAPSWSCDAYMPDGGFTTLSSKDFEGSWTVLNFYPLDFTFNCPTEITSLSDRAKEFEDLGVKVAVVSTDSKFSHYHWSHQPRNKGGVGKLNIPMISDLSRKMSREFGVLNDDESDPDCGVAFRGAYTLSVCGACAASCLSTHSAPVVPRHGLGACCALDTRSFDLLVT